MEGLRSPEVSQQQANPHLMACVGQGEQALSFNLAICLFDLDVLVKPMARGESKKAQGSLFHSKYT